MSRRRLENLDPQKQEKLFDSAAAEFSEKGYDAASLNRILDRSGMSKSSLYYYFDDKADLFATMLERAVDFLFKQAGGFDLNALTTETYWSEIEAMTLKMIRVMNGDSWYIKLGRAFYRLRGPGKNPAPIGRIFDLVRRWADNLIVKGQELGVVRTDLPNSLLVDSTMALGEAFDRWSVDHWDDYDPQQRLDLTRQQLLLFRRLLEPESRT